jgi:hypothetical protein
MYWHSLKPERTLITSGCNPGDQHSIRPRGEGRAVSAQEVNQHLGADSSIATYRLVLRAHIDPATGGKLISAIRREDIRALIAGMHRKELSASRIGCAHLVISAVLTEAVRDKKLAESPCTGIQLPGVVIAADFILPAHAGRSCRGRAADRLGRR